LNPGPSVRREVNGLLKPNRPTEMLGLFDVAHNLGGGGGVEVTEEKSTRARGGDASSGREESLSLSLHLGERCRSTTACFW
jgi:hypothetical protein